MLKNYEFKEIVLIMNNGEKMIVKTGTITDLGIHVARPDGHQFIPWTSIKSIRRKL